MTANDQPALHLFGVEDGSFEAFPRTRSSFTYLCGVLTISNVVRNVNVTRIRVDGLDATEKLLTMMEGVDVDAIVLGGITFGGFNIVNPDVICQETNLPLIIYSGVKPDNERMLDALRKHFGDWRSRWDIIEGLGPAYTIVPFLGEPLVYFEVVGCSPEWAESVLQSSALVSRIPEPVRVARLIARGLSPAS